MQKLHNGALKLCGGPKWSLDYQMAADKHQQRWRRLRPILTVNDGVAIKIDLYDVSPGQQVSRSAKSYYPLFAVDTIARPVAIDHHYGMHSEQPVQSVVGHRG